MEDKTERENEKIPKLPSELEFWYPVTCDADCFLFIPWALAFDVYLWGEHLP